LKQITGNFKMHHSSLHKLTKSNSWKRKQVWRFCEGLLCNMN